MKKKAVTEITSFVLITLLIVVASITAYAYGKTYVDNAIAEFERDRMESNLRKIDYLTEQLVGFDNTTRSYPLTFEVGQLRFQDNQVYYQSRVRTTNGSAYCFNIVCTQGVNGYERLFVNITSGYEFSQNSTIDPGRYILILKHDKDAKEIEVSLR